MKDPNYADIKAIDIPVLESDDYWMKVVAGELTINNRTVTGAVHGISTAPLYLDLRLKPDKSLKLPVPESHKLLVYVYDGALTVADERTVSSQQMGITDAGDELNLKASEQGASVLILAGKPLQEPIANWGPFVMNTREEVEQAISDYRNGTLTQ